MVGHAIVWLMVFSSFFVLFEPAPYELIGVGVIGAAFLLGLAIPRAVLPLLGLLTLYVLGGFIGVLIAPDLSAARFQISVTAFLAITSVFFACYVAVDPVRRMRPLIVAWQLGAIMAAVLGVIGYLNIAGTFELFTLFGRARGSFQDPNVFGPFLTGAVVFAIYAILSQPVQRWTLPLVVIVIGGLGILLSFSRGAWGYTAYAAGVVTVLHYALTTNPAERLRVLFLSAFSVSVLGIGVVAALPFLDIGDMFAARAQLIQSYDGGEFGRFGLHGLGFQLSLHHPLGVGSLGFREIYGFDPHNVYLNALLVHGWAGFSAFTTLVLLTAWFLLRVILKDPPLRPLAVPLFALFTGMMLVGTFIDIDRWRHFFMLLGFSWGIIAASVHGRSRASA